MDRELSQRGQEKLDGLFGCLDDKEKKHLMQLANQVPSTSFFENFKYLFWYPLKNDPEKQEINKKINENKQALVDYINEKVKDTTPIYKFSQDDAYAIASYADDQINAVIPYNMEAKFKSFLSLPPPGYLRYLYVLSLMALIILFVFAPPIAVGSLILKGLIYGGVFTATKLTFSVLDKLTNKSNADQDEMNDFKLVQYTRVTRNPKNQSPDQKPSIDKKLGTNEQLVSVLGQNKAPYNQPPTYNLQRYIDAQNKDGSFNQALKELNSGKKTGHWIWFVIPTLPYTAPSYVPSPNAKTYALQDEGEARAYLNHDTLRSRYLDVLKAIDSQTQNKSFKDIMGDDVKKLKSSLTLFRKIAEEKKSDSNPEFNQIYQLCGKLLAQYTPSSSLSSLPLSSSSSPKPYGCPKF